MTQLMSSVPPSAWYLVSAQKMESMTRTGIMVNAGMDDVHRVPAGSVFAHIVPTAQPNPVNSSVAMGVSPLRSFLFF